MLIVGLTIAARHEQTTFLRSADIEVPDLQTPRGRGERI
jgi:hypothetical protein